MQDNREEVFTSGNIPLNTENGGKRLMQKCPTCAGDNQLTSLYCERCGAPLKSSATTISNEIEYTIPSLHIAPPPPPPQSAPPSYSYVSTTTPSTAYSYHYPSNEKARPRRTIGNTVTGVVLYLIGASSTALGTFGSFQNHIGPSWAAVNMLSIFLVSIIVLIIVLVRYRLARLRWWHRLLWGIASTGGMTILLLIGYGILESQTNGKIPPTTQDLLFGSCFIIYGLLMMFLALW